MAGRAALSAQPAAARRAAAPADAQPRTRATTPADARALARMMLTEVPRFQSGPLWKEYAAQRAAEVEDQLRSGAEPAEALKQLRKRLSADRIFLARPAPTETAPTLYATLGSAGKLAITANGGTWKLGDDPDETALTLHPVEEKARSAYLAPGCGAQGGLQLVESVQATSNLVYLGISLRQVRPVAEVVAIGLGPTDLSWLARTVAPRLRTLVRVKPAGAP